MRIKMKDGSKYHYMSVSSYHFLLLLSAIMTLEDSVMNCNDSREYLYQREYHRDRAHK